MGGLIDVESVVAGAGLFMLAAMPAGLTRRRRELRSANPDADGRVVASMATMAKVITEEVMRLFIIEVVAIVY